jgi:hypothetical protein
MSALLPKFNFYFILGMTLVSLARAYEPIILEDRRRNAPTIWEWFGYLYERVKEVSEREHGSEHVVNVQRLGRRLESDSRAHRCFPCLQGHMCMSRVLWLLYEGL